MRIAILSSFQDFNAGYSLSSVVSDQITALRRHGHDVVLFVSEQYNHAHDVNLPEGIVVQKMVPFGHLVDYQSLDEITVAGRTLAALTDVFLTETLVDFDVAITHDWIFTGWFLPYAIGVRNASKKLPHVRWAHWIHSVPCPQGRDWWDIKFYGPNHKIIFPNRSDAEYVRERFKAVPNDVRVIPHIRDLRSLAGFCSETCRFIDDVPNVMQADVVMVYPASTDRLAAKRTNVILQIAAAAKRRCLSVCCVICNQWATGRQRQEDLAKYMSMAEAFDLKGGEEFVFTSLWDEKYATGIPHRMVWELLQCANLFVFPTQEESFGLVAPEAALAGNFLVLNQSLPCLAEIFRNEGMYAHFGSHCLGHDPSKDPRWTGMPEMEAWVHYIDEIAGKAFAGMRLDKSVMTKSFVRRLYNWDAVYMQHYQPFLEEEMA